MLSILSVSAIFVRYLVVLKSKDDMYQLHIFRNISWNGINLIIASDRIIEKAINAENSLLSAALRSAKSSLRTNARFSLGDHNMKQRRWTN